MSGDGADEDDETDVSYEPGGDEIEEEGDEEYEEDGDDETDEDGEDDKSDVISQLLGLNDYLTNDNTTLRYLLETANKEIYRSDAEYENLSQMYTQLQTDHKAVFEAYRAAMENTNELNDQLDNMKKQHENNTTTIADLQSQLENVEEFFKRSHIDVFGQVASLNKYNASLRAKMDQQTDIIMQQNAEISILNRGVSALEHEKYICEMKLIESETMCKGLTERHEDLRREYEDMIESNDAEMDRLSKYIDELQNEKEAIKARYEERVTSAENMAKTFRKELELLRQDAGRFFTNYTEAAVKTMNEVDLRLAEFNERDQKNNHRAAASEERATLAEKEVGRLREELASIKLENETIRADSKESVALAEEKMDRLREELASLRQENETIRASSKESVALAEENVDRLQAELASLIQENETIRADSEKNAALSNEEARKLQERIESLEQATMTMNGVVRTAYSEKARIESEYAALSNKHADLTIEWARAGATITDLQDEVYALQSRNATMNIETIDTNSLIDEKAALEQEVTAARNSIAALEKEKDALQANIRALESMLAEAKNNIDKSTAAARADVESTRIAREGYIKMLESKLDELQGGERERKDASAEELLTTKLRLMEAEVILSHYSIKYANLTHCSLHFMT